MASYAATTSTTVVRVEMDAEAKWLLAKATLHRYCTDPARQHD
jgi:hypothetical protein